MNVPEIGSLVYLYPHPSYVSPEGVRWAKGYDSPPNDYGYHRAVWVPPGLGVVVDKRSFFTRVLAHGKYAWFEAHQMDVVGVSL